MPIEMSVLLPPGAATWDFLRTKASRQSRISFHSFGKSVFKSAHACRRSSM